MDVRVRDVPELTVVSEERKVDQAELQEWLPGAMARVAATAGEVITAVELPYLEHATDDPVFVVIYEGNPNDGPTPVEVCAPVRTGSGERTIPARREAYVRVTKETVTSGRLGSVYEQLDAWIAANGHRIGAAPRETYWTDFHTAAPADDVFDVSFPLA